MAEETSIRGVSLEELKKFKPKLAMREAGAYLTGTKKESDRAEAVGAEARERYEDEFDRLDDTVRHGVFHGLLLNKKGKMDLLEKAGTKFLNWQSENPIALENKGKESSIDVNNNKFSVALRKKMIDEGNTSEEDFVDAVVDIARGLRKGKESPEIDGLKLQLSLGKLEYKDWERKNILGGPTPYSDEINTEGTGRVLSSKPPLPRPNYAKGGTAMKKQMEMFEEGGLKDDGTSKDPVSGNDVPSGSMAEEVRDDIPAQLSEGEYVVPADVVRFYGVKFFEDLRTDAKMGLANMERNGRIGGEPVSVTMIASTTEEKLNEKEEKALEELMGAAKGGLTGYAPGGDVTNESQKINQSSFNPANYSVVGGAPKGGTYPNQTNPTVLVPYVHATDPSKPVVQVPTVNGTVQQGFVVPQGYIPQSEYKAPAPKVNKGGGKGGGTGTANKPDNDPWGTTEEYDFNNWGEEDYLKEAKTQLGKSGSEALGQGLATAIAGPVGYIAAGAYNNVDGIARVRAMAKVAEAKGLDDVAAKLRTEANEAVENSGWLTKFSEKMGWIDGQNKFDAIMKKNPITSTSSSPVSKPTPILNKADKNTYTTNKKSDSSGVKLGTDSTEEFARSGISTISAGVTKTKPKVVDSAIVDSAADTEGRGPQFNSEGGLLTKPKRKSKTVKPRGKGLASK